MTTRACLSRQAIERLLRPRSVAIVGASPAPGALGASVLANLERMRYAGQIYLINPKREEIGGRPCLKSISDLPAGVDVAVLAIPRAGVLDAVRALGARQAGAAIIFSSGFAEGGEIGRQEQREIARIAAEHDMVIEGPNCLGLVNHVDGVALTFVETPALPLDAGLGSVAFDIAFGGAFYAIVDARPLNVGLTTEHYNTLIDYGRRIKRAVLAHLSIEHPFEPDMSSLFGVIFTGEAITKGNHSRNVTIFEDGEVDRSATGTGVSARAALLCTQGKLNLDQRITIESILGSTMTVEAVRNVKFGPCDAVIP